MNEKKWICSERPITIFAIVKTWLSQESRIWPRCDVAWRQRRMRTYIYIVEKAAQQRAQNVAFGIFAAAGLLRLTGWFHISICFYSSKMKIYIVATH